MNLRRIRRFVGIHELSIGMCTGIVLCAIGAVLLFHEGVKRGQADQRLKDLGEQKVVVDQLTRKHRSEVELAKKAVAIAVARADSASHRRNIARTAFEMHGDTVRTASATQVLLPEIADYVRAEDAAALKEATARRLQADLSQKQDTLEADHVKRELIDDEQQRILERQSAPRCGFKCGAAIGAGVTLLIVRAIAHAL